MKRMSRGLAAAMLLSLMSGLAFGQAGWVAVTGATDADLNSVSAPSGMIATVVGVGRAIARTTDGGATWQVQDAGVGAALHCVSFANDSVGVTAGENGDVLFTQNAGATWNVIQTGWAAAYFSAQQISPQLGFLAGTNAIFSPYGHRSTDGWQTYQEFAFYAVHDGVMNEGSAYGEYFFNADTGCAAMSVWDGHGAICRTVDGGQHWTTVYWGNSPLVAITSPRNAADALYAAGYNGAFLASTDRGLTWTERLPLDFHIYGLSFANADTGWVVGVGGRILRTNNGGVDWHEQTIPVETATLRGVEFVNADTGYAVGDEGLILRTTTGGEIPAAGVPAREALAGDFTLSSYPNPFNPTTTISFSLPKAGETHLRIFDIEGRSVLEKEFGTIAAGTHNLQFDGRGLASGVYFARLQAGDAQVTKKMLLMK